MKLIIPATPQTTLAQDAGLCPHDTGNEYAAAIQGWIRGEHGELEMNSRLMNLKSCASCRFRLLRGETLADIWG